MSDLLSADDVGVEPVDDDRPSALDRAGGRGLVVILVLAAVIRVAWCVWTARAPSTYGDPFAYLQHADEIARGEGYHTYFYGVPTAYYPVGYPGLIGVLLRVVRAVVPSATAIQVAVPVNVVCGVATVGLVHDLGRRVASPRVGRAAALAVALFPSLIAYTATAYTETVFAFLAVLVTWLVVGRWSVLTEPSPRRLALLGAALGGTALVRPVILAVVPVLVVAWLVGREGWWRTTRSAAVVVLVAAVVVAPWSIRSTRALNGFVTISTNAGDDLCIGHADEATGHYEELLGRCWAGYEAVPAERRELTRDHLNSRRALRWALTHPKREVELLALKVFYLVRHDHESVEAVESNGAEPFLPPTLRTVLHGAADAYYYVVGLAALAGGVVVVRRRDRSVVVVLAVAAALLAVPLLFFGGTRFHVPALPLVAVLAAVALDAARPVKAPASRAG